MFYSIVVAVYLRSEEIEEFLQSMIGQKYRNFEIIVSDGSPNENLRPIIEKYSNHYQLKYIYEKNLRASESRNLGCKHAKGDYFIFIDSDCIVPEDYLLKIEDFISKKPVDAFGGPDKAHESFTAVMKAINYAMTSLFTTGGIRGKKNHVGKFNLRGFNMGISRNVFEATGGFSTMQVAEDIELSVRLNKMGFKSELIPEAFVYHKRKSNFKKFSKQLHMHGKGRIDLFMRHSTELKPVHMLPSVFLLYLIVVLILLFTHAGLFVLSMIPLVLYSFALFIDSTIQNKSIFIGVLSTWASFLMLASYGWGMIKNTWSRIIMGEKREIDKDVVLKL